VEPEERRICELENCHILFRWVTVTVISENSHLSREEHAAKPGECGRTGYRSPTRGANELVSTQRLCHRLDTEYGVPDPKEMGVKNTMNAFEAPARR